MKSIHLVSTVLFLLWGITLNAQVAKEPGKPKKSETAIFEVSMSCGNCKAKIEKNIAWEKGVKDLKVNLEQKTVTVTYDPKKNTEDGLKKAIEKLGYTCEVPRKKE